MVRSRRPALAGVTFHVPQGSVTGVLGPSGCGKTTLLRSIVGTQARVTGVLRVLGQEAGSAVLRDRVGYMTQTPSVYPDLTVAENLQYFAAALGLTGRRGGAAVETVLQTVDLTGQSRALVGRLSGGQRSRVSLAIPLLGDPELLVLDEPTVGLDPVLRRRLWDLFHALAASGKTLLVSSHVMDEAERCDRLLLLREGVLLACTGRQELLVATGTTTIEDAFLHLIDADRVTP